MITFLTNYIVKLFLWAEGSSLFISHYSPHQYGPRRIIKWWNCHTSNSKARNSIDRPKTIIILNQTIHHTTQTTYNTHNFQSLLSSTDRPNYPQEISTAESEEMLQRAVLSRTNVQRKSSGSQLLRYYRKVLSQLTHDGRPRRFGAFSSSRGTYVTRPDTLHDP